MSQQINQKKLEFAERVILLRRRMNLSQVEFGKKLGVSDEYVSQIEKGKKLPGEGLQILVGTLEGKFQPLTPTDSNSVEPPVALHDDAPEYLTTVQWKDKALKAEAEVKRLRLINRLLTNEGISSNVLDDLMETLSQADRESLRRSRATSAQSKTAAPQTNAPPAESTASKKHST